MVKEIRVFLGQEKAHFSRLFYHFMFFGLLKTLQHLLTDSEDRGSYFKFEIFMILYEIFSHTPATSHGIMTTISKELIREIMKYLNSTYDEKKWNPAIAILDMIFQNFEDENLLDNLSRGDILEFPFSFIEFLDTVVQLQKSRITDTQNLRKVSRILSRVYCCLMKRVHMDCIEVGERKSQILDATIKIFLNELLHSHGLSFFISFFRKKLINLSKYEQMLKLCIIPGLQFLDSWRMNKNLKKLQNSWTLSILRLTSIFLSNFSL